MKNFSKLFLASLLAGSLIFTGCGGENPTGADVSGNSQSEPSKTDPKEEEYEISGKIVSANKYIASNAKFEVTITDANNNSETSKGESFKFFKKAGSFTITAKETSNGNYTMQEALKVNLSNAAQTDLELVMQFNGTLNSFNFTGNITDNQGNGIPFSKITGENITDSPVTMPDSGIFGILNINPGTYNLVVSKSSFSDTKIKLYVDEEGKKITIDDKPVTSKVDFFDPATGNTVNCFDLGNISMSPNLMDTGAMCGILLDPTTNKAVASGTPVFIYKRNEDPTVEPTLFMQFATNNSKGYFYITNLQSGYYCAATERINPSEGTAPKWMPSKSGGNVTGYNLPAEKQLFSWMQVSDNTTTTLPSLN